MKIYTPVNSPFLMIRRLPSLKPPEQVTSWPWPCLKCFSLIKPVSCQFQNDLNFTEELNPFGLDEYIYISLNDLNEIQKLVLIAKKNHYEIYHCKLFNYWTFISTNRSGRQRYRVDAYQASNKSLRVRLKKRKTAIFK